MATDAELLVLVEAAIAGTLGREAQEIEINNRRIESFSPRELFDIRNDLVNKIAQASTSTSRTSVATFRRPS